MFPSCIKDINLNTTIKCHDFLWASRVKSDIWHMFCISKPRADRGKLVLIFQISRSNIPRNRSNIWGTKICFGQCY